MKKIQYILLLVVSLSFASCDDYFAPNIQGSVSEDIYFKNLNNLRLTMNTAYNIMQTEKYQRSELLFGEAISDNCWTYQDVSQSEAAEILNFRFTTDNTYILERYQTNYQGINKVNQIIRNVHNVEFASESSKVEVREVYGQAKLLRALFYFNLVKTFGGVSIQPEEQELENLVVKRSSVDEVYAYIEKDLRESLLLLRQNRYQLSEAGQSGVGAALGLLMKVLLYQASAGTPLENPDREAKWLEAREIGAYFIDGVDTTIDDLVKFSDRYSEGWDEFADRLLLDDRYSPDYYMNGQDVVNIHSMVEFDKIYRLTGEFSAESLMEINHYDYSQAGVSMDESWKMTGYMTDQSKGKPVFIGVTKELSEQFSNDPRKLFTMSEHSVSDYYRLEEDQPLRYFNFGNNILFTKYYVYPSEGGATVRNYRVMRYTEALLIYAEVLNNTGDTPKAIDIVNKVRARARKLLTESDTSKYQTVMASNFKDVTLAPYDIAQKAILKEKRIEMAGEYDRWFEICRLGVVANSMKTLANNAPADVSGIARERGKYFKKGVNEIFPIPQKEVFISNGVIEQNFGY